MFKDKSSNKKKELDFDEMIGQLKEKFNNSLSSSEQVKILTVLPQSWSERRIADEFETTKHKARVAKN